MHYGLQDDPKRPIAFTYGKKTQISDHVNEVIKANTLSGLAEQMNDIKESKYASNVREPFGKTIDRNYNFPAEITNADFQFGVPTKGSESAKDVLFPLDGEKHETDKVADMYIKTHGDFAAGQQKNRNYHWPVDVNEHVFGKGEKDRDLNEEAKCLNPERNGLKFPNTIIVQKDVEDFQDVTGDPLGKPKNNGQGQNIDLNVTHGAYKIAKDQWNAAKCIYGEPGSLKEIGQDEDVGKCTKLNCTNKVRREVDSTRAFGIPTIRTDIPPKKMKSISEHQNFGDELPAIELMHPKTYLELGISEEDFTEKRPLDEVKKLIENVGYKFKIGKFMTIYNRAQDLEGGSDKVSIRAFLDAMRNLADIE